MALVEDVAPLDGGEPVMRRLVLAYLREEGMAAAQAGRREWAESYLQRALALDSEDADLWALLGTVVDGRLREVCARQALSLNPEHSQAQQLLAAAAVPAEQGAVLAPAEEVFLRPAPRLRPGARPASPWERLRAGLRAALPAKREQPRPVAAVAVAVARPSPGPATLRLPQLSPLARGRLLAAFLVLLVLVLDVVLAYAYVQKYEGRFFPGVRIAGIDVGGVTPAEANALLEQRVAPLLSWPVQVDSGQQAWSFSAAEVGLHYRVAEATQEALALGRQGVGLSLWWEQARVALQGQEVPLLAEVRSEPLQAVLDVLSAALDRTAIPPQVSWQDGGWVIAAGQDGQHVVRAEAGQRLLDGLAALVHGDGPPAGTALLVAVPLVTETAALPEPELASLRAQLDWAGRPLVLRCREHTWTLTAGDIAPWLRVELVPAPGHPAVRIDRSALQHYLDGLAPQVELPVQLPRMEVTAGRVAAFQPGRDGRRLDLAAGLAQMQAAFQRRFTGEEVETVELSTVVLPAGNDSMMAEMGVVELVGGGRSSFVDSSPNRITNIVVGGQELHGRLIAPDEIFSLNAALDPISWEKGYVPSDVISGGSVTTGMGGGLCQLATTLFRAALYSGLEIVERTPHLWRLAWYEQDSPPGFDATIMLGGPDLKIRNNTGHYLLIQVETNAEEGWQTIRFYGTSPGWTVSIGETAISNGGHDVSFVRTVSKDGVVLRQETIYSHYQ